MPDRITRIKTYLRRPPVALGVGLTLFLMVVVGDYLTTYQLRLSPFYLLVVLWVAWGCGSRWGLAFALASFMAQFVLASAAPYFGSIYFYVDNFNRLISYVLVAWLAAQLKTHYAREHQWARIDHVTGLLNRRGFHEALRIEIARHRREHTSMSVAYLDCDNFKAVNDQCGHLEGDRLLEHVAQTIRSNIRKTDVLGRLGGDEFGIVLVNTDRTRAVNVVDKLRQELDAVMAKHRCPVTFSVGLGIFADAPESEDVIISFVDKLMYQVKVSGKNSILAEIFA